MASHSSSLSLPVSFAALFSHLPQPAICPKSKAPKLKSGFLCGF